MKNILYINFICIVLCLIIVMNSYMDFFLGNNLNEMLGIALFAMLLTELYYIVKIKNKKN